MAETPAPGSGRGEDPARGPAPDETLPDETLPDETLPDGTGPGGTGTGQKGARRARRVQRGFLSGGPLDTALPGAALARDLDRAPGPDRTCTGASDDEVFGMLGRWEATEAWCAAAKLGVIRELIRRRMQPGRGGRLSSACVEGLVQEVSNQLGISARAAGALIDLAAALETRLPRTRQALETGVISLVKARIIAEAIAVLDDDKAAAAEALIAGDLAGKTPGQVAAMIGQAVVTVDPEGARKRRERAQKEDARVRFWHEHAGTAALAAFGLPPDEALAANQHIQDRALACKAAGMTGTMDQLRVRAFLDALNGTPAPAPAPAGTAGPADATGCTGSPDGTKGPDDGASEGGADGTGGGPDSGNGSPDPGGPGTSGPARGTAVAANTMLTIPLATLLGLADNPGEANGWGAIDPALARQMAAAAARNPRSSWCVTITDDQGHAIGHGCAKPTRTRARRKPGHDGAAGNRGPTPVVSARDGPGLTFTPTTDPGPDGGYGTWHLKTGGRDYTVRLHPIPVTDCDHRYESAGYKPSALLRHLVEVRDGTCTQPTCARAARRCDFEHAVPYDKGGKTCGCNGGCRCRRDHRVKQSPGWTVTQPRPGYHQWTTPSGRTYTSEPVRYPI